MKRNNLYVHLAVSLSILCFSSVSLAQFKSSFSPQYEPMLRTAQPKENIYMVLDDSYSMMGRDIYMIEHAYGFGKPRCADLSDNDPYGFKAAYAYHWGADREKEGMYNPFPQRGVYVPWDPEKADDDGLINGKTQPPPYPRCAQVTRGTALSQVVQDTLIRYKDKAYLGGNVINKYSNVIQNGDGVSGGLVSLPLDDYSQDELNDFKKKFNPLIMALENLDSLSGTPTGAGIYHALKVFRGGSLATRNLSQRGVSPLIGDGRNRHFPHYRTKTPLRYRCQSTHIVNMSDGQSGGSYAYGLFVEDIQPLNGTKYSTGPNAQSLYDFIVAGVNQTYYTIISYKFDGLGALIAGLDLRLALKPIWDETSKQWVEKTVDDVGMPWHARYSKKMSVVVNSISLGVNPAYSGFRDLVEITGGKNIEFTPESDHNGLPIDYSSEDLASAFSAIFSGIVQSSSSTLAVNDKVYADVLPKKVQMRASGLLYLDGKLTDLSSVGAIRYTTSYGFEQRYGVISAVIPYIIEEKVDEHGEKFAEIGLYELWNTNQTIKSGQGRYITYLNENQAKDNNPTGTRLYRVHSSKVRSTFSDIYKANNLSNHDNEISHTHIHWLYEFTKPEFSPYNLRARMTPMGSIINSDIRLANKDILNVNISKKTMSQQLNKEMIKWLQYKAQWQPRNYIIASDNDGFINFINAQRGLRKEERYKGGQLDTAYFPQISYHRIDEIAVKDKKPVRVFDGHTNLTDAKVYQKGRGNYYATLGMTGMGAGGKGLVGYRILHQI